MATIIARGSPIQEKLVNAGMWAAQVVLATVFAGAGIVELSLPAERLAESMPVSENIPLALVRAVGALQLLAVFALMLPTASRALSRVAAGAAGGLAVLMLATSMVHAVRGELHALPVTLSLSLVALFCAWARLRAHWAAADPRPSLSPNAQDTILNGKSASIGRRTRA